MQSPTEQVAHVRAVVQLHCQAWADCSTAAATFMPGSEAAHPRLMPGFLATPGFSPMPDKLPTSAGSHLSHTPRDAGPQSAIAGAGLVYPHCAAGAAGSGSQR